MPFTYFFATQADLAPGLAALQRERPLQFVRCRRGGWLDSAVIPTYTSLLEATDLDHLQFRSYPGRDHIDRLDLTTFFVLDAATPVYVEEHLIGSALPDGGTIHYRVALPENDPRVHLTPGGLQPSARVLWSGELEAVYDAADAIRLYRKIVDKLFDGFKRFGSDLYGPEALALGSEGMLYAYEMQEHHKPWTVADLLANKWVALLLVNKPDSGRLSLDASWNWLEASGYEVPRNADGTPRPYGRRPRYDSDPDQGFSFFRTYIDELEMDHLTIPRTYIGKSRGYQTSFRQSDLSRSRFAANTFAYCDFTGADLSGAYLADSYLGCTFDGSLLAKADLRWSVFEQCTFTGAKMTGAKLLREQEASFVLSEKQRTEVAWHEDAGPVPPEC